MARCDLDRSGHPHPSLNMTTDGFMTVSRLPVRCILPLVQLRVAVKHNISLPPLVCLTKKFAVNFVPFVLTTRYIRPYMPSGSSFMRNPPPPLEACYPLGIPEEVLAEVCVWKYGSDACCVCISCVQASRRFWLMIAAAVVLRVEALDHKDTGIQKAVNASYPSHKKRALAPVALAFVFLFQSFFDFLGNETPRIVGAFCEDVFVHVPVTSALVSFPPLLLFHTTQALAVLAAVQDAERRKKCRSVFVSKDETAGQ